MTAIVTVQVKPHPRSRAVCFALLMQLPATVPGRWQVTAQVLGHVGDLGGAPGSCLTKPWLLWASGGVNQQLEDL